MKVVVGKIEDVGLELLSFPIAEGRRTAMFVGLNDNISRKFQCNHQTLQQSFRYVNINVSLDEWK